jgi:hypothetical protein
MPTLMLPCTLTDEDRLRISSEQTAEITAQEQVEGAKKAAVKDFNVAIKQHRAKVHDFNESLRTGTELRDIEVEERPDYVAGIVFIHRLDTGECVKQRAIDPDERQLKNGLQGPQVLDGGKADEAARADEQRDASTPEEAEALRAERLANERADRISAAVVEARGRITVVQRDGESSEQGFDATLQFGNRVLAAWAETEDVARAGIETQVTEILEAQEDEAHRFDDAIAASQAEQKRQEIERLAADQAADEASTPKRGFKKGLQAPKRKRVKSVDENGKVLAEGGEQSPSVVDPEQEVLANESVPVDADGKPLAF